jgi:hypothetical protein
MTQAARARRPIADRPAAHRWHRMVVARVQVAVVAAAAAAGAVEARGQA